jgi:hypothetical protein
MPWEQPRGPEKDVAFSYEYGEERAERHADRHSVGFRGLIAATEEVPEDDKDEDFECVESRDERGKAPVDCEADIRDMSDSSKASSVPCLRRMDCDSPLRKM